MALWHKLRDLYIKKIYFFMRSKPFVFNRVINGEQMHFFVDSFHVFLHASGYQNFEPETQQFIKEQYKQGDVVYDIGANMGIFSMYSSLQTGNVFAFEPHPHNYSRFVRNIELNDKQKHVKAYCVACYKKTMFGGIRQTDDIFSTFDEKCNIGGISFSIDDVVNYIPFPNHIKIDVDGNEPDVIDGMKKTLYDGRLKTVLVELHPAHISKENIERCKKTMLDASFVLSSVSDKVLPTGKVPLNYFYIKKEV